MMEKMSGITLCGAIVGLVVATAVSSASTLAAWVGPVELRVNELKTPLGIDDQTPRFSWQLQDTARGAMQTAYQIEVMSKSGLFDYVAAERLG